MLRKISWLGGRLNNSIKIGTAAWTIPAAVKARFGNEGTHLERYSRVFNCVEINSSFYKEHKLETFQRWGDSTPADFSFSVKLSRDFTHKRKLKVDRDSLKISLSRIKGLGDKFQVLLMQLPRSVEFDLETAKTFFGDLRNVYPGCVVLEPRNMSWVTEPALELFHNFEVTKVKADPEPCPVTELVGRFQYLRMHGSPDIYRSKYSFDAIIELVKQVSVRGMGSWCIFDNTTFGFAAENALEMRKLCGFP